MPKAVACAHGPHPPVVLGRLAQGMAAVPPSHWSRRRDLGRGSPIHSRCGHAVATHTCSRPGGRPGASSLPERAVSTSTFPLLPTTGRRIRILCSPHPPIARIFILDNGIPEVCSCLTMLKYAKWFPTIAKSATSNSGMANWSMATGMPLRRHLAPSPATMRVRLWIAAPRLTQSGGPYAAVPLSHIATLWRADRGVRPACRRRAATGRKGRLSLRRRRTGRSGCRFLP